MKWNNYHSASGRAAQKAQNALCFHYNICYDVKGQPKSKGAPRDPKPTYQEQVATLNTVSAYPNPSEQYVTISFSLIHAMPSTVIVVFDGLGRQIESRSVGQIYQSQQLFDTRKLPNGVYLYHITQNGEKVSHGKFVVTH